MPSRRRREESDLEDSPEPAGGPATQRRRIENDAAYDSDDSVAEPGGGTSQRDSLDDMVKKLVRFALACEYSRRPIRRADISEKVLGNNGRQFKAVFAQAQAQLRAVFGMEMVELPVRDKVTLQQRRAAQKAPAQSKPTTSWILTNILPSEFRDPNILPAPAAPTAVEESGYIGIYSVLVSLISLSGGSLPDAKMERYLRRLQMEDNTPIPDYQKTEKLMKRLEKDGYILRIRENTGTGEDDIYWVVGPRGKVEIGDNGVRGLTKTVFGSATDEEDEELERKIARSLGLNERPELQRGTQAEPKRRGRPRLHDDDEHARSNHMADEDDEDDE